MNRVYLTHLDGIPLNPELVTEVPEPPVEGGRIRTIPVPNGTVLLITEISEAGNNTRGGIDTTCKAIAFRVLEGGLDPDYPF